MTTKGRNHVGDLREFSLPQTLRGVAMLTVPHQVQASENQCWLLSQVLIKASKPGTN